MTNADHPPGPLHRSHAARVSTTAARLHASVQFDDCGAVETLTAAVGALTAAPGHPAADELVQALMLLAQACRRRAEAISQAVHHGEAAGSSGLCPARAELLADRASDVAAWGRRLVVGGDPGTWDRWLGQRHWAAR